MISGAQTIAVTYWKAIGAGDWKTIGTGGGWPGDNLVPLIEEHLREGTPPAWVGVEKTRRPSLRCSFNKRHEVVAGVQPPPVPIVFQSPAPIAFQ